MNRCRLGEPTQAERPTPAFWGSQNTAGGRRPRARQPMITAIEIRDLWEAELREEAERLDEPESQPWEELAYMRWHLLRTSIPVIKPDPERTWLWSDLHLGDETFALLKRRPFPTTEDMDRELLASWRATVRPDDLIICLGDVAVASFWTDPEHVNDVRSCPGRRLLIRGNHDVRQRESVGRGKRLKTQAVTRMRDRAIPQRNPQRQERAGWSSLAGREDVLFVDL